MTYPLSVTDLRSHITTGLDDTALTLLRDAWVIAINTRVGPPGSRTEILPGGQRYVATSRPISSVTSVAESWFGSSTTLDTTDYRVRSDGYYLERLTTGTNGRSYWYGDVVVIYDPVNDEAERNAVLIALLKLAVTESPGLTSERIGEWAQTFVSSQTWNPTDEYEAILSRLDPEPQMTVVGSRYPGTSWSAW